MSRGIVCDKCGKSMKDKDYEKMLNDYSSKTLIIPDDYMMSRGLNLCFDCMEIYRNVVIEPTIELKKRLCKWFWGEDAE